MARKVKRLGPYDFRGREAEAGAERHHVIAEDAVLEEVGSLSPYYRNPRRGNVPVIAESLAVTGQYRRAVANRGTLTGRPREVLAGNHTRLAAELLSWTHVGIEWVDVDEATARRIVLIDNRSNDVAGYDPDELEAILKEAQAEGDLAGSGYSVADIAALFPDEPAALTDEDDAPDVPDETEVRSKLGDVWVLGPHRVLHGDSTDAAAVADALGLDRPDACWTDPPYGVSYVGGNGLSIMNDGKADLPELLLGAFSTIVAVCRPGAPVYIAHADSERFTFELAARQAGLLVRQSLVWVKDSLVMGRADYHWRHEPILAVETPPEGLAPVEDLARVHDPLLYGFTPGGKGRLGRGGPWWYGDNKGSTVFEVPKPKRSLEHPTMKPVHLIRPMLDRSLPPGGLVLDLFGGSGSTLIAAHHHRSRAFLVELDGRFVDVICRRWQEHTGVLPVLEATGEAVDFSQGVAA